MAGSRGLDAFAWIAIAVASLAGLAAQTDLDAPPRFDGAGYAVLARSLLTDGSYREIDHPERPRHAHFPPGYPLALAGLWALTGPSTRAAHLLSCACTLGAVLAFGLAFRRLEPRGVALRLGLALAINWRWDREGGQIQSEPLFLLVTALAILVAIACGRRGGLGRAAALGLLLGGATLVRHVGAVLALATLLDLLSRGRRREAVLAGLVASALLAPWLHRLATVRAPTQLGLFRREGLAALLLEQALFYARRIPDQIIGPVIEVATVFRPSWSLPSTLAAVLATAIVLIGWGRCLRSTSRRIAGLVPAATLPLLLAWPFTEAGRFLIPLVPFLLIGAVEGLAILLLCGAVGHPRRRAATMILIASLPYSAYSALSDRAEAQRRLHEDFDAACAWIKHHDTQPGPVLTRHPGEVFWQTGRNALEPPGPDPDAIEHAIRQYGVAYLLIDHGRYAGSPESPLDAFVRRYPERARLVWREGPGVSVYQVHPPPALQDAEAAPR